MLTRLVSVLLFVSLAACQGQRETQVPAEIRAAIIQQLAEVGITAEQIDQAQGLFKPADLTSQAAPDWLVDFNALPNGGPVCGTGGCVLQVWVKIGQSPYALAFARQVLGHEVARHNNGRRWLAVELHGVLCGGTGSDACRYHFEWRGDADAPEGYFAAASIWGKPLRYEGPLVQALAVQAPVGSVVAQTLGHYRAACTAAGGTAQLDEALVRLPDLNRDGRPEWLFDANLADCQHEGESVAINCTGEVCHSRLFTEQGGQGWQVAWSGIPFAYAVDFSQPEPRLFIRPADCEEQCPEQALAWQGNTRRFVVPSPKPLPEPAH